MALWRIKVGRMSHSAWSNECLERLLVPSWTSFGHFGSTFGSHWPPKGPTLVPFGDLGESFWLLLVAHGVV